MAIKPTTNIKNLNDTLGSTSGVYSRLSSGKRINKAADDPAGLAIAESLKSDSAVLKIASRNVSDGLSVSNIADGALSQISDISGRLSELAEQSANGTLSDDQRGALKAEYDALSQEANRIVQTTEFNGKQVLTGGNTSIQVGTSSDGNSQIAVPNSDVTSQIASIASQDISTQAGAKQALDQINNFIGSISSSRGDIGASESRLNSAQDLVESSRIEKLSAESRIRDEDVASALAQKTSLEIQSQTQVALAAQANKLNSSITQRLLA